MEPPKFTEWRLMWDFEDDQLVASQELREELNQINAPVLVRIVRKLQV